MPTHVLRRQIGEVVGGHANRLHGRDGAAAGVGDTLLQAGQPGAHGRLVAQARGHLPHQPQDFRAGLDEAKNGVRQQQQVAAPVVAAAASRHQHSVANAKARTRRLVRLGKGRHHVGQHASGLHLTVQLLAFAQVLADAAENTHTFLVAHQLVDHLGQQHRFAHARAAKQARLAAVRQRCEHINRLDAGLENFRLGQAAQQRRWRTVCREPQRVGQRRPAADGVGQTRQTCAKASAAPPAP